MIKLKLLLENPEGVPPQAQTTPAASVATQPKLYDVGTEYASFEQALEQARANFEASVVGKLKGKKIKFKGSKGYGQLAKDWELTAVDVNVVNPYNKGYEIIIKDGKKDYYLDKRNKVQIVSDGEPAAEQPPQPQAQPAPNKAPEAPTLPNPNGPPADPDKKPQIK